MKKTLTILGIILCISVQGYAQNDKKAMKKWSQDLTTDFDDFRSAMHSDFDDFRKEIMAEYLSFLENPWQEFEVKQPLPAPKEDPAPPVVMPEEDKDKPIESNPITIEESIPVINETPQPQPVVPIEVAPVKDVKYVEFEFFGTKERVRFDMKDVKSLSSVSEKGVVKALEQMSRGDYDLMIVDCLSIRGKRNLSDWAYLCMLNSLSEKICGKQTNEAQLLMAYIFIQSGYQVRFGLNNGILYMLYSSRHTIYNQDRYLVDGEYYYGFKTLPDNLSISSVPFPKEQSLSLILSGEQILDGQFTERRTISAGGLSVASKANKNMLAFYTSYPTSMIGSNDCSRWAMYANMPMPGYLKDTLYGQLKEAVKGKTQLEAVNMILNLVQNGLEYEYDDKVWGHDRAFFPEESLYYPYCDCEDRAILFTRLIRDILGLKCLLVYYPGHLASAVNFTDNVSGDYIMLDNRKYVIADPTYINAPVGYTMSNMDNSTAKVILLE